MFFQFSVCIMCVTYIHLPSPWILKPNGTKTLGKRLGHRITQKKQFRKNAACAQGAKKMPCPKPKARRWLYTSAYLPVLR